MSIHRENVEFSTIDGLKLRGWLYPAKTRGPAVIITPGFNCVKEMFVPQVAEQFQQANVTALVYDPRTLGESEGQPRNNIDPAMQASDYSDACTFLREQAIVDPDKIVFWGMSFAATIAMCAAALDKRAKACIAICPLLDFEFTPEKFPKVLARSMRDRESRVAGNEPVYLPVLTEDGKNPAGMGLGATKDELNYMLNAQRLGAPRYENRTTLQSYYKIVAWQPHAVMKYMHNTPVLMVVPELDLISPPEQQKALFATFVSPKNKMHIAEGKGHLNVLSGDDFPALSKMQADYIAELVG